MYYCIFQEVLSLDSNLLGTSKWNRKILQTYWIFIIAATVIDIIWVCFSMTEDIGGCFVRYVIIPTLILVTFAGIAELANRFLNYKEYIIAIIGSAMVSSLVYFYPGSQNIIFLYMLPFIVSMSYFNCKLILCVTISNIGFYLLAHAMGKSMHSGLDAVVTILLFIIGAFASGQIMSRSIYIYKALIRTRAERQDLLIKNTLMDKMNKLDSMTGLYNHETFHIYLDNLIRLCSSNDMKIILAIIDIDDFKQINDNYGHRAGDAILTKVAGIIKASIDQDDFAARYGGEEFAVIFTEKSLDTVYYTLENIRETISKMIHQEIGFKNVTVSIGMQLYNQDGKEKLFNGADAALYRAKRNGKNQTVMAS